MPRPLFGHGPMREALIEITRQESNEGWMEPGIGVDSVHGPEPVAMANRSGRRGNRRFAGAADRLDTGVPEAVHRSPLLTRAIVQLAQGGRCGPGVRRHVGPEAGQRRSFFQDPRELLAGRGRNAVQHDSPPEIEAGADASHIPRAPSAEVFVEQRHHVPGENAARRELIAIPRLGQERFALQPFGGALDRLFERQVLECVQGVVVNEDADGSLRRQQVRQLIDHARQRMVRCAGVAWAGIVEHRRLESIEIF